MERQLALELADLYHALGFVCIPIQGKRPPIPGWQTVTAERCLDRLQKYKASRFNLGILTGVPSQIVVVDVDRDDQGLACWRDLLQQPGHELPTTLTVVTGGGGLHYYFQYDQRVAELRNANRSIDGWGIDFRTTGGQVVAPGSLHSSGQTYQILDNGAGSLEEGVVIQPMPDWLVDLFKRYQK